MDLSSGYPFSLIKHGYLYNYPALKKNVSCDVAIIGGGISGALVAYYLSKQGAKVIVVDKGHIGLGSTSISTSLIQYELDQHLTTLKKTAGKKTAETSYKMCLNSIFKLAKICEEMKSDCEFEFRKSIYIAKYKKHIPEMKEEAYARQSMGIDVKYAGPSELKEKFNINANGALISDIAAEMDVFKLTHEIFQSLILKGCDVFDKTEIKEIKEGEKNATLYTTSGFKIKVKKTESFSARLRVK